MRRLVEPQRLRLLACELTRNLPSGEAARLLCGLLEHEAEPNVCAAAVEVLAEVGYTAEQIAKLHKDGVLKQAAIPDTSEL